jgi:cytochrome P450
MVSELLSSNLPFPAPYTAIEKLPYFDACIKEGLRMHPVVGHIFERIVPATGLTLPDGTILPPGTIVGVNPWVIHYKESIFGEKPYEFRPERWLQGELEERGSYEARIKRMKDADMSFGGGNRICLGKPLALVELYKVVATVFGRYKVSRVVWNWGCGIGRANVWQIELEDPSKEWELHKQWFVWPHDIKVKLSPLESA